MVKGGGGEGRREGRMKKVREKGEVMDGKCGPEYKRDEEQERENRNRTKRRRRRRKDENGKARRGREE